MLLHLPLLIATLQEACLWLRRARVWGRLPRVEWGQGELQADTGLRKEV